MPTRRRRTPVAPADDGLRLPPSPGVFRRFWAGHPVVTDIVVALACLLASLAPAVTFGSVAQGGSAPLLAWSPIHFVAVAACVLVVWRRRLPVVVFAASIVVAVAYFFLPSATSGVLVLVGAYALAAQRSSRAVWTGLAIGVGTLAVIATSLSATGAIEGRVALESIAWTLVLGLLGALAGVNVRNRRRYVEAIIDRSRQLLVERDQRAQLAAAEERARIAREMHDVVSHSLTVIVALSEGAAATDDRERSRNASDAAAAAAREALTEMRGMLGVLRDRGPDAPLEPPEPVDPEAVVAAARRAGYPATLTVVGASDVPHATRYAIGRIVQEGVTNAMRHAPHATTIDVRIDLSRRPVVVEVDNDGVDGNARREEGFGLRGLAERVIRVGGAVTAGPVGATRWSLRAELPAPEGAAVGASGEPSAPSLPSSEPVRATTA
ncbi:sensor histidine kinase [Microbacterium immunditiarum]|uniref:histidine kinase n=1 Tax=Microbacterium immunditiarum TaxID=337480 RepID=A0A7Y9GQK4_9MICO|nr:histidine kinase [Microbacterium immunditiarum]NYE20697.1 signal transduction histidine kinase [Microbacterium immunditiarum]